MADEIKSLKIKNAYVEKLINFLDTPMHGSEARERNKFVTFLGKQLIYLQEEKKRIIEDLTDKDENNKPKFLENGAKYDITPENLVKANEEYQKLLNEDFVIDILPSNKNQINIAAKALLKTTKTFNLVEGAVYDALATEFETM